MISTNLVFWGIGLAFLILPLGDITNYKKECFRDINVALNLKAYYYYKEIKTKADCRLLCKILQLPQVST